MGSKISVPVAISGTRDYLTLLNGILKLTTVELDVLSAFLDFDPFVCATKTARKAVAEKLGMKNVAVLNNYVKALKDKGIINKDSYGNYKYIDIVSPKTELESIEFMISDLPE